MRIRTYLVWAAMVLTPWLAVRAHAQSTDAPLGDIARSLRKNRPPPRTIIDNDNLPAVMEEAQDRKWGTAGVHFSLGAASMQAVNVSSPDVTCALSFSAQDMDPLGEATPSQKLPDGELMKLDGPASITGDVLQIAVFNGTNWSIREITVGLTIVRRPNSPAIAKNGSVKLIPASIHGAVPAEKRSDVTLLFHLKGTAAPMATTLFRETLSVPLGPDQEWHWAIVEAKGIPPVAAVKPPN